jgi:branched-chain amino acid transport system ATP-binding protein
MLLEVDKLDLRYSANHAVRGVSLHLAEGEIVAVLGANGAGKSSLLKGIMGAAPISGGRIRFGDQDITSKNAAFRVRSGITLVPEGRQIFVSLSVEENLLMGAYARSDADISRDAEAVFERFPNLAERRHAPASVLSGGEQQMLAVGRALLSKPRLMMLDEPSLGLSPILVKQLFALISDLNREGLSILLVEQNTHMALKTATRGYVLELGVIRAEGPSDELAANERLAEAYLGTTPDAATKTGTDN